MDAEEPQAPQQIDPLGLASDMLLAAMQAMSTRAHGGTIEQKIALGHALATHSLAQATRWQVELAARSQQQPAAAPKPGSIVIPHLVANGQR